MSCVVGAHSNARSRCCNDCVLILHGPWQQLAPVVRRDCCGHEAGEWPRDPPPSSQRAPSAPPGATPCEAPARVRVGSSRREVVEEPQQRLHVERRRPRLAVERLAAHADGRAHVPRGALGFLGRHRAQQFLQHRLCASGSTSSAKAFAPRRQAGRWYRARRASQRKTAESQAPASPRPQCGRWQIPPRPRARPLTIAQRVQSARRTGTQKQVVRTRKITCEVCSARLRLDPSWKVRLDHFLG